MENLWWNDDGDSDHGACFTGILERTAAVDGADVNDDDGDWIGNVVIFVEIVLQIVGNFEELSAMKLFFFFQWIELIFIFRFDFKRF
jgi:hypothetical protein